MFSQRKNETSEKRRPVDLEKFFKARYPLKNFPRKFLKKFMKNFRDEKILNPTAGRKAFFAHPPKAFLPGRESLLLSGVPLSGNSKWNLGAVGNPCHYLASTLFGGKV